MSPVQIGDLFVVQRGATHHHVEAEGLWIEKDFLWFPQTTAFNPDAGFRSPGAGLPVQMIIDRDAMMQVSAAGAPAMAPGELWYVVLRVVGLPAPLRFETTETTNGTARQAITRLPANTPPGVEAVTYELHKESDPLLVGRPDLRYDAVPL